MLVRVLGVLSMVLTTAAWGQGATVVAFPLDVLRLPRKAPASVGEEWRKELKRLLHESGVVTPNSGVMKDLLESMPRMDCDRENQCLRMLALKGSSLYGLYVGMDTEVNELLVRGRVVRNDGVEVVRVDSLRAPVTAATAAALGKELLGRLVQELSLKTLPAARPATPEPQATAASVAPPSPSSAPRIAPEASEALVGLPPPPPPPVPESLMRPAGIVTASVGGAAAVGGLVLLLFGRGQALTLFDAMTGALLPGADATRANEARVLQGVGVGLLGVGAASAAVGLLLAALAPASKPLVELRLSLGAQAAAVLLSGVLP